MFRKIFKFLLITGLITGIIAAAAGGIVGTDPQIRLTRDLPNIERISDYRPKAVTSFYADDGSLIGETFEERRYPVSSLAEVPKITQNAFLAAEDADFYRHPGVDFFSIFRAVYKNLMKKKVKQGASTITQQVVKSLFLTPERTYERKAKEAILSYRIEKALQKDEIFTIYLNQIFFGNTAYGIKAAARTHFHKELDELNLAESAFLAGLPQQPSRLVTNPNGEASLERRRYVLNQMLKHGMISEAEKNESEKAVLTTYPASTRRPAETAYYFLHAETVLEEQLKKINPKWTAKNPGGFEVRTMCDVKAHRMAIAALQRGLRELDKRRGWRGPLMPLNPGKRGSADADSEPTDVARLDPLRIYRAQVLGVEKSGVAEIALGQLKGIVDLKQATWAQRFLDKKDNTTGIDLVRTIKRGDLIEVSLLPANAETAKKPEKGLVTVSEKANDPKPIRFQLDQTPDIEGSFVVSSVLTGAVKVILGGYDYRKSGDFNRATQGLRQPGSSFKPFVYLSALEALHYTPSTIVPDSPISLVAGNGQWWTPGNFDHKFLGPITVRTALQRSRNVVSVFLIQKLGADRVIEAARRLGIATPIGKDLSISLGTAEIKLIEMVRAYGAFAAAGWLADTLVITEIKDRNGKVVLETRPTQKQVIKEADAFIMASMMKGVVERGTATVVKQLNRPVAGKTGTTNDQMDAWFLGYTPEWTAGVWTGFDLKKTIGRMETGGKAAAPIFVYFMQEFLKDEPPLDFDPPDDVIPMLVNIASGRPTSSSDPGAFVEYFKSGTEPKGGGGGGGGGEDSSEVPEDYLQSDEF